MAEHFDALVVGRSLAAALCATLLAKRKLRVRLVPPDPPMPEPWPVPAMGLKASPIVRRVLEELGLQHAVRTRLDGELRAIGVALPDRRFTLETDLHARGVELGRAFPEHRAALLALFDRIDGYGGCLDALLDGEAPIPPEGFAERRQVRRILSELPVAQLEHTQPPVPAPLQGLLAALHALTGRPEAPGQGLTAGAARSIYLLCHGVVRFRQGPDTLRTIVEEKLITYGGQLETRRRAARIEVAGKAARAIVTGDGHRVTADAIVFGDDDTTLLRLCPETALAPVAAGGAERVQWPPGTLPAALVDPTGWQPDADARAVLLQREGDTLRVVWPTGEPPALEAFLPLAPPPTRTTPQPVAVPVALGPDPLDLWRSGGVGTVRHLVRVGAAVVPGLGLEGEALTAWHGARRVEAWSKGSPLWPFGRR